MCSDTTTSITFKKLLKIKKVKQSGKSNSYADVG